MPALVRELLPAVPEARLQAPRRRQGRQEYHQAATPHQRAQDRPAIRKRPVITMNARFKRLRLRAQQRTILDLTSQLETLAQAKAAATPPPPPAETGENK